VRRIPLIVQVTFRDARPVANNNAADTALKTRVPSSVNRLFQRVIQAPERLRSGTMMGIPDFVPFFTYEMGLKYVRSNLLMAYSDYLEI